MNKIKLLDTALKLNTDLGEDYNVVVDPELTLFMAIPNLTDKSVIAENSMEAALMSDSDFHKDAKECAEAIKLVAKAITVEVSAILPLCKGSFFMDPDEKTVYDMEADTLLDISDFHKDFMRQCQVSEHIKDKDVGGMLQEVLNGFYPDLTSGIIRAEAQDYINEVVSSVAEDIEVTIYYSHIIVSKSTL